MLAETLQKTSKTRRASRVGNRSLTLLDTSIGSLNLGDQIIMDAVEHHLATSIPNDYRIHKLGTHVPLGRRGRRIVSHSQLSIVGGTNLLSPNHHTAKLWDIGISDALFTRRSVVGMGLGWTSERTSTDRYSRYIIQAMYSDAPIPHSVRDDYTAERLTECGVTDVLMTGCPTTWQLGSVVHSGQSHESTVVLAFNRERDPVGLLQRLLPGLRSRFSRLLLWPQGARDREYASEHAELELIAPSLAGLDGALGHSNKPVYLGTRLHAGVRALQYSCPSTILSIDNRASGIAASLGLPAVPATDAETSSLLEPRSWNLTHSKMAGQWLANVEGHLG